MILPNQSNCRTINVFKIWIYCFLILILLFLLIILFHIQIVFFFFIYSEIVWLLSFFLELLFSSYSNDPRFILIGLIILVLAALEIICIALYLNFQATILKL